MNLSTNQLPYVLQLADNALIIGHRISEWCGHGPILEQDIALTNTSLDHLGQARSLYQYASEIYSALPAEERETFFTSPALDTRGKRVTAVRDNPVNAGTDSRINESTDQGITEDDLAYLRDSWDFRNVLLAEQPNEDWAYTVIRSFYYDAFQVPLYTALQKSSDKTIAAIAEKSLKEATYHLRWSSEWVIRLGDGTEESRTRIQKAIKDRQAYTGELFMETEADRWALSTGVGADLSALQLRWNETVREVFAEAGLDMPDPNGWMQRGGKEGRHSEHLGYILAEMQYMQRAYPGMEW
jgi:ring-1,2-phenylacetyl-CoA epoxidase subunit PaaC